MNHEHGSRLSTQLAPKVFKIERQVAASGCTYFVCRLAFGNMSEAEAAASIALFTAEVMPRLIALAPPAP